MAPIITPVSFASIAFDYLIAGGGTAGLTLAARLSENPHITVGVIEAGFDRTEDPNVLIPGFAPIMWEDPDYDWIFKTVPQKHGNNRIVAHPRGKQLGGSSAINFNYWTHASQQDINDWGKLGSPGWSWEVLLPYFLKSETYNPPPKNVTEQVDTTFIEPSVHGLHGPVQDSFPPFYDNFYRSWEPTYKNLGLGPTGDPKAGTAIGAYTTLLTIEPKNASRSYAGNSYYKPNAARSNLHVLTGALVTKVVFAKSKKPLVATGVTFAVEDRTYTAFSKREVILSAGSFQSPQLLELSGVGDPVLLRSLGIDLLYANHHVGENLQDHILVYLGFEAATGEETFESLRNASYFAQASSDYTAKHTGPLTSGTCNAYVSFSQILTALKKKGPVLPSTDKARIKKPAQEHHDKAYELTLRKLLDPHEAAAQEVYLPGAVVPALAANASALFTPSPIDYPSNYFSLLTVLEHPLSRGSVHITSSNPTVYPAIDPNYLSHPLDLYVIKQATLHLQQVARTGPLSTHLKDNGEVFQPGYYELNEGNVESFVKNSFSSEYHPIGTCAMGPQEKGGVVDEKLKVHGTKNLRVVDASVFPLQIRGNLASLVYAVAERASDFIKSDQ